MTQDAYDHIVTHLFPGAKLHAVERLTGGVSADVRRLDVELVDGRKTSLVVRTHGASHSGHSAELEYQLLHALHRRGIPVAEPLFVDTSGRFLADPFLVMTFIAGTSTIPTKQAGSYIDVMADTLMKIHALPTADLPALPLRSDPLPELFDYLPEDREWNNLRAHLRSITDTAYLDPPTPLHGDFWPENLIWQQGTVAAILDWEDAAVGDPLSDVAVARLELRYNFGTAGMQRFTRTYATHRVVDRQRLALWQVYVAAAAQRFMGDWGLAPTREAHMRTEALTSLREAATTLVGQPR